MAINVRIPEELDRQLEAVAAAEHVSKNALLLRGAQLVVERHERRKQLEEGLNFVLTHDKEFLDRLADA
ncbi:toxin-antitoxin system HicB family antitoxin [Sinomonas sp. ASV486]|uniref:toxin-antitoxin system HicB family antitoxin n=1 Tax=Sinomonas sp. ASV486 TaxID=3051170 RepID=UPI0027DAFF86|nr:toxin-antitoxin system HicB family antitoxin [Sinomonas sp. ASV486]MDQ4489059.1 toxin-antitoxin system HicB family antitoxin [Sinomonas sp. ASV486]